MDRKIFYFLHANILLWISRYAYAMYEDGLVHPLFHDMLALAADPAAVVVSTKEDAGGDARFHEYQVALLKNFLTSDSDLRASWKRLSSQSKSGLGSQFFICLN